MRFKVGAGANSSVFQGSIARRLLFVGASSVALAMACSPALAAQAQRASPPPPAQAASPSNEPASQIEDVVVTAQRRSENLQDVPITVSAVTEAMLQARGLRTTEDLNTSIPNLNVARSPGPLALYLRGIGQNGNNPGNEQNVAIYIDGVYIPSVTGDLASFNNVARIEVLKGPQGTLFGRNTTGGLLQIITKDPSHTFSGRIGAGYGNYETFRSNLYVTGPITPTLAADLSVTTQTQGQGWGHNIVTGREVHYRNDLNLRSKLLWNPSADTRAVVSADYTKTSDDVGSARNVLPDVPPLPATFANYDFNGNIYDVSGNAAKRDRVETGGVSLHVRHDFDRFSVVNISAWRDLKRTGGLDLDQSPAPRSYADPFTEATTSFSNEFQVLSPSDAPVSWIVGAYYFHADARADPYRIGSVALGPAQYQEIYDSLKTDSYAVFGQAVFPLFDEHTHLTTGVRYTIDEKTIDGTVSTALGLSSTPNQKASWSEPTLRVSLDRAVSDNLMVFGSVSTGYKSGVFNATSPLEAPVNPEYITAYEVGAKSDLLENRLRLNGAAYYYDYTDIQVSKFTGLAVSQANAAAAKIYGVELEVDAYLTDRLRINGGVAAQHSEFTEFAGAVSFVRNPVTGLGAQTVIDATGNRLPRAPDLTWNIGMEYVVPLAEGRLAINANYYHNDGFDWDADNRLKQPAYNLVNGSLAWTSPSEAYVVRVWGANLLDKAYYSYVSSGANNPDAGSPAAPRTFGVSIDYNF